MGIRRLSDNYFEEKYGKGNNNPTDDIIQSESPYTDYFERKKKEKKVISHKPTINKEVSLSENMDKIGRNELNLRQSIRILKDIINRDYGDLNRRVEEIEKKIENLEKEE